MVKCRKQNALNCALSPNPEKFRPDPDQKQSLKGGMYYEGSKVQETKE